MRAEIRAMLNRGGGAIVNMSSTAGLQGVARIAAYCATKHGVVGLSNPQRSTMRPVKRIGDPKDVADLVRWLCSSEAQFITGTVVTIDGGKLAGTPAYSVGG
jgi:NAD(P)-dependent dehydrogenase (short-subunit alcohol dehydrogenase family)